MSSAPPPQVAERFAPEELDRLPTRPVYQANERILDCAMSAIFLVLLAPVWLALVILIKLDSKGSVYYTQSVVGRNGAEFIMYKFRSMVPNSRRKDHITDLERNFLERKPTGV